MRDKWAKKRMRRRQRKKRKMKKWAHTEQFKAWIALVTSWISRPVSGARRSCRSLHWDWSGQGGSIGRIWRLCNDACVRCASRQAHSELGLGHTEYYSFSANTYLRTSNHKYPYYQSLSRCCHIVSQKTLFSLPSLVLSLQPEKLSGMLWTQHYIFFSFNSVCY